MAILRICKYGEKILRKKAPRIDYKHLKRKLPRILSDMWETMESASGVGLAAPQVGLPLRLVIIDVKPSGRPRRIVLINPELVEGSGSELGEEGCLSLPGFFTEVRRHLKVRVQALDESGVPIELAAEGLLARAFQHELDHLDGKLIIDRLPLPLRPKARAVLRKLSKTWK